MTYLSWVSPIVAAEFDPMGPTLEVHCEPREASRWVKEQAFTVMADSVVPGGHLQAVSKSVLDLQSVPDQSYRNVAALGVLANVPREDLITVVLELARVLQPGGCVLLTTPADHPDLPIGKFVLLLESTGLMVTRSRTEVDDRGRPTSVVVAQKTALQVARGLERVQSILVRDVKFATYKLALVRAFCGIARNEPHVVHWGPNYVYVPLWSVARRWLMYYWPLFTGRFLAQTRAERPGAPNPVAFRRDIESLAHHFGAGGLQLLLARLDTQPDRFRQPLWRIAQTIKAGPVTHAGNGATPVFGYSRTCPGELRRSEEGQFGWVIVPDSIWLDISRFHHWIEDSLILRWARLTVEMNPTMTEAEVLPYLLPSPFQNRDTGEIRDLVEHSHTSQRCVWTDASLDTGFEVDHVIPYSAWGNNDLWNMLPTHPRVNNEKRNRLPSRKLLVERREAVTAYWQEYFAWAPERFSRQVERSLGVAAGQTGWERVVFAGLQETVERVASIHGLERWHP